VNVPPAPLNVTAVKFFPAVVIVVVPDVAVNVMIVLAIAGGVKVEEGESRRALVVPVRVTWLFWTRVPAKFPVPPCSSIDASETAAWIVQVAELPPSKIAVSPVVGWPDAEPPELVAQLFVAKFAVLAATQYHVAAEAGLAQRQASAARAMRKRRAIITTNHT
jgi:hypothetical protein